MSDKVTIPAELREKLAGANGDPIPLYDESGKVVAYCLSVARMDELDDGRTARRELWTDEEIARLMEKRKNDPRPSVPHDEVMRWFKENA